MTDVLKFERKGRSCGEEIPAALREFIDAVIVPALVREYLGEVNEAEKMRTRIQQTASQKPEFRA